MRARFFAASFAVFCAVFCAGCADAGAVAVTVKGDDAVSAGLAADRFEDGENVVFDRFLVAVAEVAVEGAPGTAGPAVVDVTAADAALIAELPGLRPGPHGVSAVVAPVGNDAGGANADDDDVAFMVENAFSVFVAGSAVVDGVAKRFSWGLAPNTRYVDCVVDGADGVDVVKDATKELQVTIDPAPLFSPSLDDQAPSGPGAGSGSAKLSFAALAAADDNGDDAVDLDEIAAVDLADLDDDGAYEAPAGVVTLKDFVAEQARNIVRVNIDGRCTVERR